MSSDSFIKHLNEEKEKLQRRYEAMAKALKDLAVGEITKFKTGYPGTEDFDNTVVGSIVQLKDGHVLIDLIAADKVDYKMRNIIGTRRRHRRHRRYPIDLSQIKSSSTMEQREVPLLINFNYISPQFKNTYLK